MFHHGMARLRWPPWHGGQTYGNYLGDPFNIWYMIYVICLIMSKRNENVTDKLNSSNNDFHWTNSSEPKMFSKLVWWLHSPGSPGSKFDEVLVHIPMIRHCHNPYHNHSGFSSQKPTVFTANLKGFNCRCSMIFHHTDKQIDGELLGRDPPPYFCHGIFEGIVLMPPMVSQKKCFGEIPVVRSFRNKPTKRHVWPFSHSNRMHFWPLINGQCCL